MPTTDDADSDPAGSYRDVPPAAGAVLTIDLGAIVDNWRLLARTAGVPSAAVVKADGYGLGAAPVGQALARAGCEDFFVAQIEEGVALRSSLPQARIAVLNGTLPGTETTLLRHRLTPVLNDPGQVERWLAQGGGAPAILHVDTGMNRLGIDPTGFGRLADDPRVQAYPWAMVMSHLACADEPDHVLNEEQRRRFDAARRRFPSIRASLAASSGVFLGSAYAYDMVRPGAALYGIAPCPNRPNPLRRTVALAARILQVRAVDRGMTVGYGAAHSARAETRVATIAVGYADGYLRSGSGRGQLRIAGFDVPLIGRVSMDLVTVDVTAVPETLAHPGAFIEVIGPSRPPDQVAADAGTIGYEILTSLGQRYHRRYLDG
jgi:alanine racemase